MSKTTVSETVPEVRRATTAEEIQELLEHCSKWQMREVFLCVTNLELEACPKSWKKADLVKHYTARVMAFKAREAFKNMDAEARAEYLISQKYRQEDNSVDALIWKLSPYELIALNVRLGVSFEEYKEIRTGYGVIPTLHSCIRHAVRYAFFAPASKNPVEAVVTEVKPDYDAAFDEDVYMPDYQATPAVLDDIPEDHEPDIQPVPTVSYEDVREAYESYLEAEDRYVTSHETDMDEKEKSDKAYRRYLMLLGTYRRGSKPKREEVLNWLRKHFSEKIIPADGLSKFPRNELDNMSLACGIHAGRFLAESRDDMAVRLLREAGIEPGFRTSYEYAVERRKEEQHDLHEIWQRRHVLRKVLRLLGEDSEDAEILRDMCSRTTTCPVNSVSIERLLKIYKRVCSTCADGRRYEAECRLADTLAMSASLTQSELEAQTVQTDEKQAPVQESTLCVEPEVSEPEIRPVLTASYEDVQVAYESYIEAQEAYVKAQDNPLTSNMANVAMKEKVDKAYSDYLSVLAGYRQGAKPERESSLRWIRDFTKEGWKYGIPSIDNLEDVLFNDLINLCHKCGINAADLKNMEGRDIAERLLREAGIRIF